MGLLTGEVGDDDLFENANYQTGKCQIKSNHIEEFEKFVEQLDNDYLLMSKNPASWNTTVGILYDESFQVFINVRNFNS